MKKHRAVYYWGRKVILFWKFEYLYDNDKKIYIYIMNVEKSMGLGELGRLNKGRMNNAVGLDWKIGFFFVLNFLNF